MMLVLFIVSVSVALWTRSYPQWISIAFALWLASEMFEWRELEWVWSGFAYLWILLVGLMLARISPYYVGDRIKTDDLLLYPGWAAIQLILLMAVIAPQFSSDWAGAITCGLIFMLLHIPNLFLMLATGLWGFLCVWVMYYIGFNPFYAALAHGIGGSVIQAWLDDDVTGSWKVGLSYAKEYWR